ncbi:hypothetical protein B0H13DRAFT_1987862 [Mycena leptocephala]|nr:hypothetical protein B0H13DRAFT_1987862 [Mycena leptocephala]
MQGRTRSGKLYHPPWEDFASLKITDLLSSGFQVHQTDVSLEELLAAAQDASETRSQAFEDAELDSDDGSEWEDVDSRPPSPLSPLPQSRSPSPETPVTLAASPALPDDLPDPVILPLADSPLPSQKSRKALHDKRRRQVKRQKQASSPFTRRTSDFDAHSFETTKGGHWLGRRRPQPRNSAQKKKSRERWNAQRLRTLKELLSLGYFYIRWDGKRPLLILDRHGRIIAVMVGAPEDPEWPSVVAKAAEAMRQAREEGLRTGAFTAGDDLHRRGLYHILKGGVSYGGGQKRPGNLVNPPLQQRLFQKLVKNTYVRRVCGFQSSAFRTFGPKLFDDYVTDLQALFDHHPGLQHNFSNSIYPAVTFNLGPQSVAFDHVDDLNRPLGLCAVTNAVTNDGGFDHKKSAHLYMKQLKLETRYSITQYAAGGLFRWVKYGFRTAKQVLAQGGRTLKDALDGAPGKRHDDDLDLFSKVDGLVADHAACFGK